MQEVVRKTYGPRSLRSWEHDAPMEHASGVWGRGRFMAYLSTHVRAGETIVDLGCGAGQITALVAQIVGPTGHVFGYDIVPHFIVHAAQAYAGIAATQFAERDVSMPLPHETASIDRFISCMLIQNMEGAGIRQLCAEIGRCLKPGGEAVFLTIHPAIWEKPWRLEFIQYDDTGIDMWRRCPQDDLLIRGCVASSAGGTKDVFLYTHSRQQVVDILRDSGLRITQDIPIHIDKGTAEKHFGTSDNRQYPVQPIFWMFSVCQM